MKALSILSLSSALVLAALMPGGAQSESWAFAVSGSPGHEPSTASWLGEKTSPARQAPRRTVRPPSQPQENAGIEPDEIDLRATDEEPRAGLLLPAVQNYSGETDEPCQTAGFMKFDPIEGDAGNAPAASGPGAVATPGTPEPCEPQATNFGVLLDGSGSRGGDEGEESRAPGEAEITLKAPGGPDN